MSEKRYATLDDALYEAAAAIYASTGGKVEATSAVYRLLSGEYGFSNPTGSDEKAHVSAKLKFPKESLLMALVHNHPEILNGKGQDADQSLFSANDIEQAKSLGVLSAIAYGPGMSMRTFMPGRDKESRLSQQGTRMRGERASAGTLFDYIPEVRIAPRRSAP